MAGAPSAASGVTAPILPPADAAAANKNAAKTSTLVRRQPPLRTRWNLIPCFLMLAYLASGGWYFWKRIEVMTAGWNGYQLYFIILEFIGVSAFLPYALLLTRGVYPTGSPGLDPSPEYESDKKGGKGGKGGEKKGEKGSRPPKLKFANDQRYHVRVLVPCYKESLETVADTVNHALEAALPENVDRTVYLCDDGKDPIKQQWIEALGEDKAVYVTGRVRKTGEVNGKSANLNNCLKNVIYKDLPINNVTGITDWKEVHNNELLVVFDADMCANPDFFLKIIEIMIDPSIALCLTPQAFHNVDTDIDIFNAINAQFWEYWLPGAFAWGYIACTGTNFCLRVRALAHCGWFPEYTITEDYALGMELKSRGYKATYLADYIARGEAPLEIRNVFRQRSRWTKGHYQVFYSRHNPLINFDLPVFQRLMYAYATWSPMCTVLTVPGFMLAPLLSVVWGLHPLVITYEFVLTSTIYFTVQLFIQFYCTKFSHLKLMWFVQQSNVILWFTYYKAFFNTSLAALGLKVVMFKATDKVTKAGAAVATAVVATASATMRRRNNNADGNQPQLLPTEDRSDGFPRNMMGSRGRIAPEPMTARDDMDEDEYLMQAHEAAAYGGVPPGSMRRPPLPPGREERYRRSSTGVAYDGVGEIPEPVKPGRRVSYTGVAQQTPGRYGGYDPVRRVSQTSMYDPAGEGYEGYGMSPHMGPQHPQRMSYNGGAGLLSEGPLVQPEGAGGYSPLPRLPSSRHASGDGGMLFPPSGGRMDVRRMETPRVPADTTHSLAPPEVGELEDPSLTRSPATPYTPVGEGLDSTAMFSPSMPAPSILRPDMASYMYNNRADGDGGGMEYRSPLPGALREEEEEMEYHAASGGSPHGTGSTRSVVEGTNPMHLGMEHVAGLPEASATPAYKHVIGNEVFLEDHPLRRMSRQSRASQDGTIYDDPMPIPAAGGGMRGVDRERRASRGSLAGYSDAGGGIPPHRGQPPPFAPDQFPMPLKYPPGVSGGGGPGSSYNGGLHAPDNFPMPLKYPPGQAPRSSMGGGGGGYPPLPSGPMHMPPPHTQYVDNGVPMMPQVGPYGMVQMMPANQFMMPGMMAGGYPPRYSYPGHPNEAYDEKARLLADDSEVANAKKGKKKGMVSAAGGGRGDDGDDDNVSDPGDGDDRREEQMQKATNENNASTSKERLARVLASFKPANVADFSKMFDPLALLVMWLFNMLIVGIGSWQLATLFNAPTVAAFKFDSPLRGNPYLLIAILWALNNSVAPFMFLYYCFSSGPSFRTLTKYLPFISSLFMLGGAFILWFMIPSEVQLVTPFDVSLQNYFPNQVAADTNTNYLFVTGRAATPVALNSLLARLPGEPLPTLSAASPAGQSDYANLLGGLLAGYDHTKAVMPMVHTITWLVWGWVLFPQGYTPAQVTQLRTIIKSGADYLMRCNLNVNDPSNPVFVAQLGDPADYVVYDNLGYNPEVQGKIWTSPEQDPQLSGTAARKAWLLTRETIGADLLGGAAGALAASSLLLRESDPAWAQSAITHARYLHNFATTDLTHASSYCKYVPCTTNVTVTDQVKAKELPVPDGKPVCYYVDWLSKTCRFEMSVRACDNRKREINEVFINKAACCSYMSSLGAWDQTYTKAQGICALPEDQYTCYTPDMAQKTCYEQKINQTTGAGCSGKSVEAFASSLACCNYINSVKGDSPIGICSRIGIDEDFKLCYIPNLVNGTCDENTGKECQQFGVTTSFDHPVGCCNYLASNYKDVTIIGTDPDMPFPRGICLPFGYNATTKRTISQNAATINSSALPGSATADAIAAGGTRRLQAAAKRVLQQAAADATADDKSAAEAVQLVNGTLWQASLKPKFLMDPCEVAGSCKSMMLERTVEVEFFNSSTIFDDLAWASLWMYRATDEAQYLGQAQRFLDQHYTNEVPDNWLKSSRRAYVADWDNQAWAANLMLAELTHAQVYRERLRELLGIWLYGDAVPSDPAAGLPEDVLLNGRQFDNFTVKNDDGTNSTFEIIPKCIPTQTFEKYCFDGIDDDCNGFTDREDLACGLFPILYSPQEMAYSVAPSLPHAANAAFLALAYSKLSTADTGSKVKCWALAQTGYMIGAGVDERSYVVGVGRNYPTLIQHRASSCPAPAAIPVPAGTEPASTLADITTATQPNCDWASGFYPSRDNPKLELIAGALISGPNRFDFMDNRRAAEAMRVSLHDNAGFMSTLAGLTATDTNVRACEALNGVWMRYTSSKTLD